MNKIIVIGICLFANLIWIVWSYDYSPLYMLSSISNNSSEAWAIRGQIGDILSGHFSALAFLAVVYTILLQQAQNKQMQNSIKKQEERSFIEDMSKRLTSYYKLLDEKLLHVVKYQSSLILKIGSAKTAQSHVPFTDILHYSTKEFMDTLNFIYDEIESIKNEHPTAYHGFRRELTLRLISSDMVKQMSKKQELLIKCKALSLLNEQT